MRNRPLCSVCLILFLLTCVGIHAGGEKLIKELRPSPLEENAGDGEKLLLTGRLYEREIRDKYQILYLKNNSINIQGQSLKESRIIVYDEAKTEVHIGQLVKVSGECSFFEPAYNPGNFDQKRYYQKQNIHARVWAEEIQIKDVSRNVFLDSLYELRQRWKSVFLNYMKAEDGAVLSAMLLGEKGDMEADLKELYQVNGIGHILAISGLHLSFIGIGIYQILRKLTGSYTVGGITGILFLTLYILMIGFTVSAVRALIMFLFRVGADLAGRHYDSPTALSVAAVVVLIWRPLSVFDGGFWLSFGAVAAVLLILPLFENLPFQGLWASVSINLMLLPVLLYYFYEFPVYSTVLNLLIIPLMSVLLFLGILGSMLCSLPVLEMLFSFAGAGFLKICAVILRVYEKSCILTICLPGARIVAGQPELWQIAVYYLCLSVAVLSIYIVRLWNVRKGVIKRTLYVSCLLGAGLFLLLYRFGESGKLLVTVLDVGQGDGIFIRGPAGEAYFVDGGSSDVDNVGKYRIEPFLKSQGAGKLDYVFISHGDSDHISGIRELIERRNIGVKIKTLVLPVQEVWDEALEELAEQAQSAGIHVAVMDENQSIRKGKLAITCVQPGSSGKEGEKGCAGLKPGNAASMVLAVRYGEFDMLLTGDVEEEGEEQLTKRLKEQYPNHTWEVLKAAHHGSKNSSAEEFLQQVRPGYALISAGKENRYGHPHEETLKRLTDAGSKIYSTQENRAIIVEVENGKTMKIEKY